MHSKQIVGTICRGLVKLRQQSMTSVYVLGIFVFHLGSLCIESQV